jgi:hypothetical protein
MGRERVGLAGFRAIKHRRPDTLVRYLGIILRNSESPDWAIAQWDISRGSTRKQIANYMKRKYARPT